MPELLDQILVSSTIPVVPVQPGGCTFCGETGVCPACGGAQIYHYEICVCYSWHGGGVGVCPICHSDRRQPDPETYDLRISGVHGIYEEQRQRDEEARQERAERGDEF